MRYPAYPTYKSTGVDWLGEVPEHWDVKAIKWESPVFRGASPRPIDDPIYFDDDDGEYAWVRISDVTASGMYLEVTEQKLSKLGSSLSVKLDPGALFLSIAGSVGKPCITRIKCCIHDGFVYFPRFKGEARFLYYIFASGEPYRGLGKMGTQLNLNTDTVGSIVIGLPKKVDQRIIADFLDTQTAKIDTLLAKKRDLIDKLKEKRTALIVRTVTSGLPPEAACVSGLDPYPPMKPSCIDWIDEIPAHWTVKKGRYIGILIGSIAPSEEDYCDDDEGTMFVKVDDLNNLDSKRNIISTTWRVKGFPARRRKILLFPKRGAAIFTNKVAIADGVFLFDTNLMGWQIYSSHEIRFIAYTLTARRLDDLADVSTVPQINNKHINPASFPVPPHPEQSAIADFLDCETTKIDRMIAKVEEAIERLQEYRIALITATVTGKIDIRGGVA